MCGVMICHKIENFPGIKKVGGFAPDLLRVSIYGRKTNLVG